MSKPRCSTCGRRKGFVAKVYEPLVLRLARPIQTRRQYVAKERLTSLVNTENGGLLGTTQATVRWEMDAPPRTPNTPSTSPQT